MSSNSRSPNSVEGLTAKSTITGKQEYITSTGGILNSGATLSGSAIPASGLTTAAAVQIVDGSGNQITSFGGGTQYTDGGVPPPHPVGGTLEWTDGSNWQTVSTAKPLPVTSNLTQIAGGNVVSASTGVQMVGIRDSSNNNLTSTASALDINIKSGSIANTSFIATQATGSNLHTVIDSGAITATPPALPTVPLYGQTTVSVTNTAVQLPNKALVNGVIVQALAANVNNVVIGDSSVTTSNGFQLQPGQATSVAVANMNDLYVNGTSADGVCYIGT